MGSDWDERLDGSGAIGEGEGEVKAVKAQRRDFINPEHFWLVGGESPEGIVKCDRIISEAGLADVRSVGNAIFSKKNIRLVLATLRLHGFEVEE